MKKILSLLLILAISISSYAQCVIQPNCTNTVNMCNTITNEAYNGNVCFVGYGVISNSVNWNNWSVLQFLSSPTPIYVEQAVNFQNGPKKVFTSGTVYFQNNFSMDGSDTLVVGTGSVARLNSIISNNSNIGQKNVIVLNTGAQVFVNNLEYYPGDTIKTVIGNNSNNVYIVACGTVALSTNIIQFELKDSNIHWKVDSKDEVQIQYSDDGKNYRTKFYSNLTEGIYRVYEAGYYRLVTNNKYSDIIKYNMSVLKTGNEIYYYMGRFYKDKPVGVPYGVKKLN